LEYNLLLYLGLFVHRVFPVKGTIFVEFQLFLGVPAVLFGSIIAPLTFAALQGHQFNGCLFARHFPASLLL
jgi:hypothetical protein